MSTISPKSQKLSVEEIAANLNAAGIPPEFGKDNSRLLIKTLRTLAHGEPITKAETAQISEELEIPFEQADEFLHGVTERDSDDNIIGLIGLSLNQDWAHRFDVNGISLRTWCTWDTLFLTQIIGEETMVESESPQSGTTVRLRLNKNGVESSVPETAVVTIVNIDPDVHDTSSMEAIWGNFCHQVYFFPSRDEADEWASGKNNIEVLTVDEAYELGRLAFSGLLQYA